MNRLSRLALLLFSLAALWGCNREYDPVPEHLHSIYPIHEGSIRDYLVIDTLFNTSVDSFATRYVKREETGGTERDLMGREISKLYLYQSPDSLAPSGERIFDFAFTELWTQYADADYAERNEGNTRYLVLQNPPVTGAEWNGNLYNEKGTQVYRVLNADSTLTLQGKVYPHCVVVEQQAPRQSGSLNGEIYIEEYAYEIYAPGIGKIARYFKYYEWSSGGIDSDSRIYREELIGHH